MGPGGYELQGHSEEGHTADTQMNGILHLYGMFQAAISAMPIGPRGRGPRRRRRPLRCGGAKAAPHHGGHAKGKRPVQVRPASFEQSGPVNAAVGRSRPALLLPAPRTAARCL